MASNHSALQRQRVTSLVSLRGFNERTQIINEMGVSPTFCRQCRTGCVLSEHFSEARGTLSGGRKGWKAWPDALYTTGELIVSERAATAFREEGLEGFRPWKFSFTKFKNKKLKPADVPRYYFLDGSGRVPLDERAQSHDLLTCPSCGMFTNATAPFLPDLLNWDGADFVRFSNVWRLGLLVSERVVDTIVEKKLTGFAFGRGIFPISRRPLVEKGEQDWRVRLYNAVTGSS